MKRTRKIIASIMTGVVALSSVVFTGCAGDETGNVPILPPQTEQTEQSSGFDVSGSQESGISLLTASISESDYETYGVSAQAESALTVTASYTPSYVTYPELDWEVSFVDETSEWATGKVVTDYVKVTPTADGALTAVVECFKAFGEQIKLKITCRAQSELYAEMSLDYDKRIERVYIGAYQDMDASSSSEEWSLITDLDMEYIGTELTYAAGEAFDSSQFPDDLPMHAFRKDVEFYTVGTYRKTDPYICYELGEGTIQSVESSSSSLYFATRYHCYYTDEFLSALSAAGFTVLSTNPTSDKMFTSFLLGYYAVSSSTDRNSILYTHQEENGGNPSFNVTSEDYELYYKFAEVCNSFAGKIICYAFIEIEGDAALGGGYYACALTYEENYFEIDMDTLSVDSTAYTF